MKAKDREEFTKSWLSHIQVLYGLCDSLPNAESLELLDTIRKLKDYVAVASKNVYGESEE